MLSLNTGYVRALELGYHEDRCWKLSVSNTIWNKPRLWYRTHYIYLNFCHNKVTIIYVRTENNGQWLLVSIWFLKQVKYVNKDGNGKKKFYYVGMYEIKLFLKWKLQLEMLSFSPGNSTVSIIMELLSVCIFRNTMCRMLRTLCLAQPSHVYWALTHVRHLRLNMA